MNLEVEGDPDKLARVFDNILRNAMWHTVMRTPRFSIEASIESVAMSRLHLQNER